MLCDVLWLLLYFLYFCCGLFCVDCMCVLFLLLRIMCCAFLVARCVLLVVCGLLFVRFCVMAVGCRLYGVVVVVRVCELFFFFGC